MKLWKILFATMIALVLVCAVAMADETEEKPYTCETCDLDPYNTVLEAATCTEEGLKAQRYCIHTNCANYKKFINYQVIPALGHNWDGNSAKHVAPTCTEEGYYYNECTRCDAIDKPVREKIPHSKKIVSGLCIAPTCTTEGVNYYQCGYGCNYEWTETVKKISCDMQYVAAKAPTCAEEGYTEHMQCSMCKATIAKTMLPKSASHTGEYKIPQNCVAPTCAKEGSDYFRCDDCGAEYTKVVKATGNHDWKEKDGKAANCTDDGYTDYEQCSVCKAEYGKVVIPATGTAHEWKANGEKKATCTEKGYKENKCKVCGAYEKYDIVDALGHDYDLVVRHQEPTCTSHGWEDKSCSRCGDVKAFEIPALDHNYVEAGWTTHLAATCNSDGVAVRVCTRCAGAQQSKAIPALGHKMAKDPAVVIPATCEEDGEGWYYCERCQLRETTVIAAKGHTKEDTVVAEADCIHVGMKHVYCKVCDKLLEANVIIDKLGHKGEVTKLVEPTCTTEGSKTTECERCGQTVTEKLAKLAHTYTWVTTPATPSADGKSVYICSCGDIADTKTIKYTKWYYNNTMTSFGPTTKELVGGNDWYRVTPVDLAVDGVYTYDLIASNKYVVGTVTISVNAGTLSVSYKAKYDVEIKDEALLIYASKADLAAGSAVTAAVGSAINTAETFGEDTKVLVSLILTGNYDAAGKAYIDADAASALAANID